MVDAFSYDDIYELLRAERYSTDLQVLKDNDLAKMKDYFDTKKQMLSRMSAGSEFFDRSKKAKLQTEIDNAFRAIKDLYAKREQKIINRSLFTTRTDSKIKDTTNMLQMDVKLYEQLIQLLLAGNYKFFQDLGIELPAAEFVEVTTRQRETPKVVVTENTDDGDESKVVKEPPMANVQQPELSATTDQSASQAQTAPSQTASVAQAPAVPQQTVAPVKPAVDLEKQKIMREADSLLSRIANPAPKPYTPKSGTPLSMADIAMQGVHSAMQRQTSSVMLQSNKKSICFLRAVPQFLDESMNKYGPFKEGDTTSLPKELADILVRQQKAKQV